MLDKIWRFLKQLIQRILCAFGKDSYPPLTPPLPRGGDKKENLSSTLGKGGEQNPASPLGKGETNLASPLTKGGLRGVPPTLTDAEYEAKLMELLEEVNQGRGRGDVAGFLIAKQIKNGDLAAWLRRFGVRLLEGAQGSTASTDAVVSLQELARRLELLGGVAGGELGECAGNVGREILVEFPVVSGEGGEGVDGEAEEWEKRGNEQYEQSNFQEALAFYERSIELNYNQPEVWEKRGLVLQKLGDYQGAIDSNNTASTLYRYLANPESASVPQSTKVFFNLGDIKSSYDKALEFKPDDGKVWFDRGNEQFMKGDFEGALNSYDKALEFKPDFHRAWYNRGFVLDDLGRLEDAIASWDKALEIKPDDHVAWYNRGNALGNLGRLEDAITSYDKALQIKPYLHESWWYRGNALGNLGRLEDAIASYDKALEIKPDKDEAWINRGIDLDSLGRLEEAIASYDKALELKPDDNSLFKLVFKSGLHAAWFYRGNALHKLGRFEDAIASYDKALEIEPDYHQAWYNRGNSLVDLGRLEDAIASYDKALEFKPDLHQAWINRGIAIKTAPKHRLLVYEILQEQFPNSPPVIRTLLTHKLKQRGYEGQVLTLQAGLEYCPQNTHPEGYGQLHQALGNAHYNRGKLNSPNTYWHKAAASYKEALKTLTPDDFLKLHLQVLQSLIKTLVSLKQTDEANKLQRDATDLLQRLLKQQNYSQLTQQQLTDKLVSFEQLTVNIFMQSGQFTEALATAETDKNVCLSWLLDALPIPDYETEETVTHAQIQQLINPTTAAIYWHLSDAALTTFIIKSDGLLSPETCFSDFPDEFEKWVKEWNQQYTDYQSKEKTSQVNHPWRGGMASQFARLNAILKIDVIEQQLEGITELILIPHRDLHRFPIHALFGGDFVISYLPSAAVGINLQHRFTPQRATTGGLPLQQNNPFVGAVPPCPPSSSMPSGATTGGLPLQQNNPFVGAVPPCPPSSSMPSGATTGGLPLQQNNPFVGAVPPCPPSILSIENPNSVITDKNGQKQKLESLLAAQIESQIICRMFDKSTPLKENAATLDAVKTLLPQSHNIFHFTGHGSYNFDRPLESNLYLSNTDRLRVKEIIQLDLSKYELICLSACETALTEKQTILAEYVGLTSGFMRAGVGSVVSTLWPVESNASALLMIYFYQRWREAGDSLPVALANAQKWLREATREDLATWYQGEFDKISANSAKLSVDEVGQRRFFKSIRQELATMELDRPYQHPYYWAAFTITGL